MRRRKVKDPDARLDYSVDWGPFLASVPGDSIFSAEWVDAGDSLLTIEDEGVVGNYHACFISGGALGTTYRITSRITTTEGRVQDQSFALLIEET